MTTLLHGYLIARVLACVKILQLKYLAELFQAGDRLLHRIQRLPDLVHREQLVEGVAGSRLKKEVSRHAAPPCLHAKAYATLLEIFRSWLVEQ